MSANFRYLHGENFQSKTVPVRAVQDASNKVEAIPFIIPVTVPNTSASINITMARKVRVVRVDGVKTAANGGAGDTVVIKSTGDAISDVIDLNVTDTSCFKQLTLDDAFMTIAAGGILRITHASATNCSCELNITLLPMA